MGKKRRKKAHKKHKKHFLALGKAFKKLGETISESAEVLAAVATGGGGSAVVAASMSGGAEAGGTGLEAGAGGMPVLSRQASEPGTMVDALGAGVEKVYDVATEERGGGDEADDPLVDPGGVESGLEAAGEVGEVGAAL